MKTPIWRKSPSPACILALAMAAAAAPACAQNVYGTMKGTPAEKFTDEDARLFGEASRKALNEAPVGESVSWSNPATKSHGELKVLKEFTWKESPCRQLRVSNEAQGRKATNALDLCKVAGKWRLVSPTELSKR